jgi:3-oxoacyl-[acyl-carrier protein] reductase
MNLDLTGRRALVCGSSQGIGLAAAVELAQLGATVTLFARNAERLETARNSLPTPSGQKHETLVADFGDLDQLSRAVSEAISSGGSFQILVNNTGGPPPGPALDADVGQFLDAFRQHLLVNQTLVQLLCPGMKESQYGRIINVISTSVKQPIVGLGVSNTVRGAVANWSKTLATELAPFGITVNNVLPGATKTARLDSIVSDSAVKRGSTNEDVANVMMRSIPAARFGEPEEIGAAIAFLASPAAGYITGINLPVDGGRTQCL